MLKRLLVTLMLTSLAACASGGSGGFKTYKIDINMTEKQVVQSVGAPFDVTIETCGQQVGAWTCKKYQYYDWHKYYVLFRYDPDGVWRVNSWYHV